MKTNSNCRSFGKISKAIFFILFLGAGLFASVANAQTLTTDRPDYQPGDTAIITGSGFWANEGVTMQIVHVDGSPPDTGAAHLPWNIVADASGNFVTTWIVDPDAFGELLRANADGQSSSLHAEAIFTDNILVDFRQSANNGYSSPNTTDQLGNVEWISSIVQSSNSIYYEGMSCFQRCLYSAIPATVGDEHSFKIRFQSTKAGIHAYDWITSWPQAAYDDAQMLSLTNSYTDFPPFNSWSSGNFVGNQCGANIGPPNTLAATCGTLHGLYFIDLDIPDDTYMSHSGPTLDRIQAYEAIPAHGNRTIRVWGNQPFINPGNTTENHVSNMIHSVGPGGDTGDSDASFSVLVHTTSTTIIIELAGHLAVTGTGTYGTGNTATTATTIEWGSPNGSSQVNGGPYHFHLDGVSGGTEVFASSDPEFISVGSQDNQIKGADILINPPSCPIYSGPQSTCPSTNSITYSVTIPGCTNPSINWSFASNTSGATFSGPTNGLTVDVIPGSSCGSFCLEVTGTCTEGAISALCTCFPVDVEDNDPPVFTSCPTGTDLGCNPTVPTCANVTAPTATDGCGTPTVTCSAGSVVNTSTCGRSKTITWTATDACANSSTCSATWTWTEDVTPPVFTNCTPGTDLGCNPVVPTCAN
ncbi:MAG: hypothetical protein JJE25_10175, partial [Bacteroidia bacterium]|nr:hypothetical protein [Bacteroidia bacterium]